MPPEWVERFSGHEALLESRRGWDPGALELAIRLAADLGAPLRRSRSASRYAGVEIEVRSDLLLGEGPGFWTVRLRDALLETGAARGATRR